MLDSSEWLYSKYFFVEKPLTLVFEHCQISAVFLREFWHWVIFFLIKVTYFNKIFSQLYVGPKNIHTMEIDSINESVYLYYLKWYLIWKDVEEEKGDGNSSIFLWKLLLWKMIPHWGKFKIRISFSIYLYYDLLF